MLCDSDVDFMNAVCYKPFLPFKNANPQFFVVKVEDQKERPVIWPTKPLKMTLISMNVDLLFDLLLIVMMKRSETLY